MGARLETIHAESKTDREKIRFLEDFAQTTLRRELLSLKNKIKENKNIEKNMNTKIYEIRKFELKSIEIEIEEKLKECEQLNKEYLIISNKEMEKKNRGEYLQKLDEQAEFLGMD